MRHVRIPTIRLVGKRPFAVVRRNTSQVSQASSLDDERPPPNQLTLGPFISSNLWVQEDSWMANCDLLARLSEISYH